MRLKQQKVILNGSNPSRQTVNSVIQALLNRDLLTEKGGYIFKAALKKRQLHIGLQPGLLNHQRTVHHAIELGFVPTVLINGFVTREQELTFIPQKQGKPPSLTPEDLPETRELLHKLCQCLLDWGLPESYALDSISQSVLVETNLIPRGSVRDLKALLEKLL